MTDWAGQAAQRTLEQKHVRDQNVERANRIAKIKAEAGSRFFQQLTDWIKNQITVYNDKLAHGSDEADELIVTPTQNSNSIPGMPDNEIMIARRGGNKEPLKIWYSAVRGVLTYECGGGREEFTVCVGDDDQPFLRTQFNLPKQVEEIGLDALNKFMAAKF